MLLLIPGSLLIAKTEEHFFNTLSDVFTSPERARTANANILVKKNPKRLLGFVSSSHFPKKTSRLSTMVKMHEVHSGDC